MLVVVKLLMSEMVQKNNYKVVLIGEGLDELFVGYFVFCKDMFLYGLDFLLVSLCNEWQFSLEESNSLFCGVMLFREDFNFVVMSEVVGFMSICL